MWRMKLYISSIYHVILLWIVLSNTDDNYQSWRRVMIYPLLPAEQTHTSKSTHLESIHALFVLLKCIKMFHFIFTPQWKTNYLVFKSQNCATLEKHIKSIKETVIVKCDLCALLFSLRCNLVKHKNVEFIHWTQTGALRLAGELLTSHYSKHSFFFVYCWTHTKLILRESLNGFLVFWLISPTFPNY